jgi:MFS family permease
MGVSLLGPVLPTLQSVFAVSDAQVGLVLTAYTIPGIFLAPFVGYIADRIGRRRVLIPLLCLFGLAGASIVVAGTFGQILVLRFVQGLGASSLIALSITLIGDYYDGRRRDEVVGANTSVIGIGSAIFPTLGGVLVVLHWTAPFAFFGLALVVALVAVVVIDEPTGEANRTRTSYRDQLAAILRNRRVLGLYGADLGLFVLFYGGVLTAMPLVLERSYELPAPQIGLWLAITSVASAVVAWGNARLVASVSISTLVGISFLVFGVAFLGIWQTRSVAIVGLMLLLFGVGIGVALPSIDRTLVKTVPTSQRASVVGHQTSMVWLGQTIGPVLFALLATEMLGGYLPAFFLLGVLSAVGGLLVIGIDW